MTDLRPRRRPSRAVRRRRVLLISAGALVVVLGLTGGILALASLPSEQESISMPSHPTPRPSPSASESPTPLATAEPSPTTTPEPTAAAFDKAWLSTTDPNSPWVVVNKIHPIPDATDYVPALASVPGEIPNPNGHRLHPFAADGLGAMSEAASAEIGETLIAQSGYRSYSSQVSAFDYWVSERGSVELAEQTSARPGFSEHQTGFAIDLCGQSSGGCQLDGPEFGDTETGRWLAENAWRFGFILRYPADKIEVTGYEYEPWHFRYVGPELSTEMHNVGVTTLEEFFGIPGSTHYR